MIYGVKIADIRKKPDQDLRKNLTELRDEVRAIRFKVVSKEVKNHQLLRQAKKSVARVLTVLKERSNVS